MSTQYYRLAIVDPSCLTVLIDMNINMGLNKELHYLQGKNGRYDNEIFNCMKYDNRFDTKQFI